MNRHTDGHPVGDVSPDTVRRARRASVQMMRTVRPLISAAGKSPVPARTIAAARPGVNGGLAAASPSPAGTRVTPVRTWTRDGQVRGEWIHERSRFGGGVPKASSGRSVLYFLHGSGYLVCSARTHRGLAARLAKRAGIGVFTLDYRLGPKYRFPAGGDDAVRGYRWLLDIGFEPEQIIVAGDSAGGHLAQDLIASNHRDGVGQPRAMILFSPLYDPTFDMAVALERTGVRDPLFPGVDAQRLLRLYTADTDPDDPRMRIALTPDMDLPVTLIQHGGHEIMADDARTVHRNILAAGGTSTLQEWPDQGHVFQIFPYMSADARTALTEAKNFLDEHLY
ncbi:MAG: alpha/beta hydrolase [Gordonia sp. (in: high G+C Gram-positive bacteria)]